MDSLPSPTIVPPDASLAARIAARAASLRREADEFRAAAERRLEALLTAAAELEALLAPATTEQEHP